jgi:hypothetical protein
MTRCVRQGRGGSDRVLRPSPPAVSVPPKDGGLFFLLIFGVCSVSSLPPLLRRYGIPPYRPVCA